MNGTDFIVQVWLSCPLCCNKEQVGDSPSRWLYLISGPYFCSSHIYRPIWHSNRLIIAYLKGTSNSMSLNWMDFRNSVKLWAMLWRATQGRLWWRVLTNVVHWKGEWQTTPVLLPPEPHELYEKAKGYDTRRWAPRSARIQYATGQERRNGSRKNEDAGLKWKWPLVVDVPSGKSKV